MGGYSNDIVPLVLLLGEDLAEAGTRVIRGGGGGGERGGGGGGGGGGEKRRALNHMFLKLPDSSGRLQPIHVGHLNVHEDEVVRIVLVVLDELQRFNAIARDVRNDAVLACSDEIMGAR
eukprot:768208-Hanusia_phi.AAC.3